MSAIVRGGATKEVRISSGASGAVDASFGAAGAALGIPVDPVALAYLNQSITGLVSACQRLMPLGQVAASRILWNLKPAIARGSLSEEASCFSPYLELASMRHGSIETRLFIS